MHTSKCTHCLLLTALHPSFKQDFFQISFGFLLDLFWISFAYFLDFFKISSKVFLNLCRISLGFFPDNNRSQMHLTGSSCLFNSSPDQPDFFKIHFRYLQYFNSSPYQPDFFTIHFRFKDFSPDKNRSTAAPNASNQLQLPIQFICSPI